MKVPYVIPGQAGIYFKSVFLLFTFLYFCDIKAQRACAVSAKSGPREGTPRLIELEKAPRVGTFISGKRPEIDDPEGKWKVCHVFTETGSQDIKALLTILEGIDNAADFNTDFAGILADVALELVSLRGGAKRKTKA